MILASLHFVDAVVLFNEETPYNLIRKVQPDVLVKGSDYKEENIVGFDIVKNKGGIVKTIDFWSGEHHRRLDGRALGDGRSVFSRHVVCVSWIQASVFRAYQ